MVWGIVPRRANGVKIPGGLIAQGPSQARAEPSWPTRCRSLSSSNRVTVTALDSVYPTPGPESRPSLAVGREKGEPDEQRVRWPTVHPPGERLDPGDLAEARR